MSRDESLLLSRALEFLLMSLRIISLPVIISPFSSPCLHSSILLHLNHTDFLKIPNLACYYLSFAMKIGNFVFDEKSELFNKLSILQYSLSINK